MESSWHTNVVKYGLGGMGVTVCARLDGGGGYILTNAKFPPFGPFVAVAELPPTGDSPYGGSYAVIPADHPNFPYGLAVEGP